MTQPIAPTVSALEERIDTLLQSLTLDEQASLLAGADFWTTVPIERVGVPAIKLTDGPNGARGGGSLVGGVSAAAFPVAISLAATWNTDLVEEVGAALGEEALSKGARVLLGPTVNIHRSPLNGRNFECYSEDPYLSGRLAVSYIRGVQSRGVSATVKHYVGNDSEFERMTISSDIGERALREIYLVPFEAAVRQAGTWALMTAYNKVNGVFAGEHPRLIRDILKGEWGFDGVVMSDWTGTHTTVEAANAGLDLEMPGPTWLRGHRLAAAVRDGRVSADAVADSARRLLRLIARVGALDDPTIADEQAIDRPEHRALIRRAGAEGLVLLKNDGLLPLDMTAGPRIAVIGPNARTAQIMGGGSAQLNAHYRVAPLDGLLAQAGAAEIVCDDGCANTRQLPLMTGPFAVEYFNSPDFSGEVAARQEIAAGELMWFMDVLPGVNPWQFSARLTTQVTPTADGEHHFSLVSAGLSRLFVDDALLVDNWGAWQVGDSYMGFGSEEVIGALDLRAGQPYDVRVEFAYPPPGVVGLKAVRVGLARPLGDEAIEAAVLAAAQADVAVLFVGLTGEWDSEGRDRPHMDLVGRQNELIARVAAANPHTVVVLQTGGPVAMPWLDRAGAVVQAWYPGQECGHAIADVLTGRVNPAGRLPQTFPARLEDNPAYLNYPGENGRVVYGEGIFVGYRYYDKKRVAPLFPFGHGLSYTTFAYDNLRLSAETLAPGETLTVTIDVTNSGTRAGQEVVQLYVSDPRATLARPEKELKGFAKVALEPGETQTVRLSLDMRSLALYDDARAAWLAEAGEFEVLAGASSADIRARANFTLTADWVETSAR
jgi:beta-glucosidase